MTVAQELNIFGRFNSYEEIPYAVRSWITIKANRRGQSPNMTHAGIKAQYNRRANLKKGARLCPNCGAAL